MWLYCCSLWLWTSKQTKGSQLPSSGWNQPGFGHPVLLLLLLSKNPSQNSLSHSSGHILSPKASQRRLSAGCFAINCHNNTSILLFFLSLVGAVKRKVVATEMRLRLTPWSLTGRRWIFLSPQSNHQTVVCHRRQLKVLVLSASAVRRCLCFLTP